MLELAVLLLLVSLIVSGLESYYERDWPRHTFRFVLLALLVVAASAHSVH